MKLTDIQMVILSAAAGREDGSIHPLPKTLKGGAVAKVTGALLRKGLIAEAPGREDWSGRRDPYFAITADGALAINVEPADCPHLADTGAQAADGGQETEPAADTPRPRRRRPPPAVTARTRHARPAPAPSRLSWSRCCAGPKARLSIRSWRPPAGSATPCVAPSPERSRRSSASPSLPRRSTAARASTAWPAEGGGHVTQDRKAWAGGELCGPSRR